MATLAGLVTGCAGAREAVHERFRDATPHEVYLYSLETAGLAETAVGRDWVRAGEWTLREALAVASPFQEHGYLSPQEPDALGYRFDALRGQQLLIEARLEPDSTALLFLDVYRMVDGDTVRFRHAVSADSGARRVIFEPIRDGTYVLRVQPELLRGGRYTVRIIAGASLAFPVEGGSVRDILSVFGDPRDGGRREHHGVDIFAPRNTPVLAAAAGTVRSVRTTRLGGRVVWLRDHRRGNSLYYAHLERQLVSRGQEVQVGDTLGLVGNSGNARTTPPHLHFGIYRRGVGPMDPMPFVERLPGDPPALLGDTTILGGWARAASGVRLRDAPGTDGTVLGELARNTPVRVLGATGDWYRVRLPDGRTGFVTARLAEPVDAPLRRHTLAAASPVRDGPHPLAAPVEMAEAGQRVDVLGEFGAFLYVRGRTGRPGWLAAEVAAN